MADNDRTIDKEFQNALVLHQQGQLADAERIYRSVLSYRPRDVQALHHLGVLKCQQSENEEGQSLIRAALTINPLATDARFNLALALRNLGHEKEAIAAFDAVLTINPHHVAAVFERAFLIAKGGDVREALAGFDLVLSINPKHLDGRLARGVMLGKLERNEEALAEIEVVLKLAPDHVRALTYLGIVLGRLDRHAAVGAYDRALAIHSNNAELWHNRAVALNKLERFEDAIASSNQAIVLRPDFAEAYATQGLSLSNLHEYAKAVSAFDRALTLSPRDAITYYNRGNALNGLHRNEEAIASYDAALSIKPDYFEALYNRGNLLRIANRLSEAIENYEGALRLKSDHRYAFGYLAYCELGLCNWKKLSWLDDELKRRVESGRSILSPFVVLAMSDDPGTQLKCASAFVRDRVKDVAAPRFDAARYQSDKLRIAYVSADFRAHPVAGLIPELIEIHDRSRFEIIGISIGPNDGSEQRARLEKAFCNFHDVHSNGDLEIARLIQRLGSHIVVDLNGYTEYSRLQLFAHRPAPLQIQYLGYPGTSGAAFIDYIIADSTVIPPDHERFFTEKIIRLPDTFFVNDTKKAISKFHPSRREAGLPADGTVFCCFNASYKITPQLFDIWMRLLLAVEGSVLWLLKPNDIAAHNLRREAALRSVDSERIVFAERMPQLSDHLARHALADLFLDTLPYNAHTTASEALWAGLPMITCLGTSFAGRVGASLLTALGLPELITTTLDDYEALALKFARDKEAREVLRHRLIRQRAASALFDTKRFCSHLEEAFALAWDRHCRGERPDSFSVASLAKT